MLRFMWASFDESVQVNSSNRIPIRFINWIYCHSERSSAWEIDVADYWHYTWGIKTFILFMDIIMVFKFMENKYPGIIIFFELKWFYNWLVVLMKSRFFFKVRRPFNIDMHHDMRFDDPACFFMHRDSQRRDFFIEILWVLQQERWQNTREMLGRAINYRDLIVLKFRIISYSDLNIPISALNNSD